MTWALVHEDCGGVAWRFVERPVHGQMLESVSVRLLDGSRPAIGSLRFCGTCGRGVTDLNLRDEFLREEAEAV